MKEITMSTNPLYAAAKKAINKVVDNFQNYPTRFWNERDIHWSLFYYLEQANIIRENYTTQLIRAEFPTLKGFGGARGHYDLVIINYESFNRPEVQSMNQQISWKDFLSSIELDAAIEIKLWLSRLLKPGAMEERVDWDIQKLTDEAKNVKNAYFLNFVQLDFKHEYNEAYYQRLRDYLVTQKKPGLNILCVPSDRQLRSNTDNWL